MIVHQDDRAVIRANARRFFEMIGIHLRHRKSLFHCASEPTENTDLIFTRCQPIGPLAKIAEIREIHLTTVEAVQKFWSHLRMMVHKKQRRRNVVGTRPQRDRLPLPFRIEQIPHRTDRFQINQLGVAVKRRPIKCALINEDVLTLGIDVTVLALPPLLQIGYSEQYQCRRQRIEGLATVKAIVGSARRAKHDVD